MAVLTNTITTADVAAALDVQMDVNFMGEYSKLAELLGILSPEIVAAGTAVYQYKVTGSLNATAVAEGDEVPLSKYTVEKVPAGEIAVKPYRKMTTAQAILKSGFENAVMRTDAAMLGEVRNNVLTQLFAYMANGTSTATGTGLQAALANADAVIQVAMEQNGDYSGDIVHFVNPLDVAAYLGSAQVTTQTAFGMTYLESFLGINRVFVTAKVEQGSFYATPASNLHVYGIDFASLDRAGLSYYSSDGSLVGVAHVPAYNRTSAETYVLTGMVVVAEVLDYIVKGTVSAAA